MDEKQFGPKQAILLNRLSMLWIRMFVAQKLGGFMSPVSREEFYWTLEEVNRLHAELFGFGLYDDGIKDYVEKGDLRP